MRLKEADPGRDADEERPQKLEAHERRKRSGPGIENGVVKASTEVDTEGGEVRVK